MATISFQVNFQINSHHSFCSRLSIYHVMYGAPKVQLARSPMMLRTPCGCVSYGACENIVISRKRDLRCVALLPCTDQARSGDKGEASLLIGPIVSAKNRYLTLERCTMEIFGPPGTGAMGVSHDTNAIRSNVKMATLSGGWRHGAMSGQLNAPIVGIGLVMREPDKNQQ